MQSSSGLYGQVELSFVHMSAIRSVSGRNEGSPGSGLASKSVCSFRDDLFFQFLGERSMRKKLQMNAVEHLQLRF